MMSLFSRYYHQNSFNAAAGGKSLLWEVTGGGLQKASYFFGTMHLMCADEINLSENLGRVIKETGQVYFEVDISKASNEFTEILRGREKSQLTLANVLPEVDYNKVKDFFEVHQPHLSFSIVEQQPPLMITSSLYELLMPCEHKGGVELKIFEFASNRHKPIFGLETIAFQASIFDSIPFEEQAKDLLKTMNNLEKNRSLLFAMIDAYKQQDVDRLFSLSTNDVSITGDYLDLLLTKRNLEWVAQFKNIAKKTSTLFAVGAGHLGGEMGVLNLLKQQGYHVRAIEN